MTKIKASLCLEKVKTQTKKVSPVVAGPEENHRPGAELPVPAAVFTCDCSYISNDGRQTERPRRTLRQRTSRLGSGSQALGNGRSSGLWHLAVDVHRWGKWERRKGDEREDSVASSACWALPGCLRVFSCFATGFVREGSGFVYSGFYSIRVVSRSFRWCFYEVLKMDNLGSRSLRLMQVREPSQKGRFTISLYIENRFKEFLSMITVAAIQRSFCF